jgi:hypothetical protein
MLAVQMAADLVEQRVDCWVVQSVDLMDTL